MTNGTQREALPVHDPALPAVGPLEVQILQSWFFETGAPQSAEPNDYTLPDAP